MDGKPPIAGLERLAVESKRLGELREDYEFRDSLELGMVDAAYEDLRARPELQTDIREMEAIVQKWGY